MKARLKRARKDGAIERVPIRSFNTASPPAGPCDGGCFTFYGQRKVGRKEATEDWYIAGWKLASLCDTCAREWLGIWQDALAPKPEPKVEPELLAVAA